MKMSKITLVNNMEDEDEVIRYDEGVPCCDCESSGSKEHQCERELGGSLEYYGGPALTEEEVDCVAKMVAGAVDSHWGGTYNLSTDYFGDDGYILVHLSR